MPDGDWSKRLGSTVGDSSDRRREGVVQTCPADAVLVVAAASREIYTPAPVVLPAGDGGSPDPGFAVNRPGGRSRNGLSVGTERPETG